MGVLNQASGREGLSATIRLAGANSIFSLMVWYSPFLVEDRAEMMVETVRIYWAKQLLISDLFTVSEIALKLHYYDVYHFTKDFKKYTNMSPKEYVRNYKTNQSISEIF